MVLNRFFNYYNAETLYLQVYNALMAMLKSMLFSNTYLTLIQCQNNVKKVVLHGDILKCTSSVMPSHYHCNVRDCCQVTWHSIVFKCKQDRLALPVSNPFKPLKAVCLLTTKILSVLGDGVFEGGPQPVFLCSLRNFDSSSFAVLCRFVHFSLTSATLVVHTVFTAVCHLFPYTLL